MSSPPRTHGTTSGGSGNLPSTAFTSAKGEGMGKVRKVIEQVRTVDVFPCCLAVMIHLPLAHSWWMAGRDSFIPLAPPPPSQKGALYCSHLSHLSFPFLLCQTTTVDRPEQVETEVGAVGAKVWSTTLSLSVYSLPFVLTIAY